MLELEVDLGYDGLGLGSSISAPGQVPGAVGVGAGFSGVGLCWVGIPRQLTAVASGVDLGAVDL